MATFDVTVVVSEVVLSVLAASDPLLDFGEKGGRKVI
jgi:excinuclease UvrABC ATPase subunit